MSKYKKNNFFWSDKFLVTIFKEKVPNKNYDQLVHLLLLISGDGATRGI